MAALLSFFGAVKYLTVADVIVIDASSPILLYIMAFLFLGEKFGVVPIVSAVLAFTGFYIIARPPLFTNQVDHNYDSLVWPYSI